MARRKKPEGETPEQSSTRHTLEAVADKASRSEKVSWDRKMDNMVTLLARLKPIENKILDLMGEKAPIFDEIVALRAEMVHTCVHPYTHLDVKDDIVHCKFCGKNIAPKRKGKEQ